MREINCEVKLLLHRIGTHQSRTGKPDCCVWKDKFPCLLLKYYSTKLALALFVLRQYQIFQRKII